MPSTIKFLELEYDRLIIISKQLNIARELRSSVLKIKKAGMNDDFIHQIVSEAIEESKNNTI